MRGWPLPIMLFKHSSRARIDVVLDDSARHLMFWERRHSRNPRDAAGLADAIRREIECAQAEDVPDLYFWLAAAHRAAGQSNRAWKAARTHLRLRPPTETDLAIETAREAMRRIAGP